MPKVCQCPICNKGEVIKEFTPSSSQDEPYFHNLPAKIYCNYCHTHFSTISLNKGECVGYEVDNPLYKQYEELLQKYNKLQERFQVIYEDLLYMNVYRCRKCGHYTMVGWVCHECGTDPGSREDLGDER